MPLLYYHDALKRAQKEFRSCTSRGEYPYLPVLDEFVSKEAILRIIGTEKAIEVADRIHRKDKEMSFEEMLGD